MTPAHVVPLSFLFVLAFAAPAAADYYTNYPDPAPTPQEFAQIQFECRRGAAPAGIGPAMDYGKEQAFAACMQARGFRKIDESEVARICALRQQQLDASGPRDSAWPLPGPSPHAKSPSSAVKNFAKNTAAVAVAVASTAARITLSAVRVFIVIRL